MRMWILLAAVCFLGLTAVVTAQEAKKVELKGTLRTDIVAIGGETTGVIIQTKEGDFELDLGKNKEIREKADKLHGKVVQVAGTLTIRKGVEIKQRKIVVVTQLEEAKK
ncbi:MAG: hypothetical protein JNM56_33835 [Planctomycetia bacterium]|nr:hypothetical protein [Planctomycetia bacterium]